MNLFSFPNFGPQSRLASNTKNPVRTYNVTVGVGVLAAFGLFGSAYYWWHKGHRKKTDDDIRKHGDNCSSDAKLYEYKRTVDTNLEAVKTQLQTQLQSAECTNDILRSFAKERAAADRYHANAMTDVEKARMMYELKREFRDIIREERMAADGQMSEENDVEEVEDIWEDYNDDVYNHPNEMFTWLIGNVIKSGGINGLIGPKGIGKTLCLTTIINCIAKGIPLELFVSDPSKPYNQPAQKVFLYDLEMQCEDLNERNGKHGYEFTNIKRNTKMYNVNSWLQSVRRVANGLTEDATIVLDNVTRLNDDVTQPVIGKRLFDGVKNIRDDAKGRGIKLTFILVAHTTNDWNDWVPLTLKAAAVADSFTTGLDSISFIGKTKYEDRVLFKVYNQRHGRCSVKVALLKFVDKPFLGCKIEGYYKENDVKPNKDGSTKPFANANNEDGNNEPDETSRDPLVETIIQLNDQGLGQQEISDRIGKSRKWVNETMQKHGIIPAYKKKKQMDEGVAE